MTHGKKVIAVAWPLVVINESCSRARTPGCEAQDHFLEVRKMVNVGSQGAPKQELAQVLPSLSDRQIGYRLKLLQERGGAVCVGHAKGARWYLRKHAPE